MGLLNSRVPLNRGDKKQCERPRILCRGEVGKSERRRNKVIQRQLNQSCYLFQHRHLFSLLLATYLSVESFYRVPGRFETSKLSFRVKGQAESCHCVLGYSDLSWIRPSLLRQDVPSQQSSTASCSPARPHLGGHSSHSAFVFSSSFVGKGHGVFMHY